MAAELRQAGVGGPLLLVGASFGALTALWFARAYPERVAGLVLLDATHPRQAEVALAEPVQRRLIADWHALQRDHAARSRRGEMRVVPGSGHHIGHDAPQVVVATIRELLGEIGS